VDKDREERLLALMMTMDEASVRRIVRHAIKSASPRQQSILEKTLMKWENMKINHKEKARESVREELLKGKAPAHIARDMNLSQTFVQQEYQMLQTYVYSALDRSVPVNNLTISWYSERNPRILKRNAGMTLQWNKGLFLCDEDGLFQLFYPEHSVQNFCVSFSDGIVYIESLIKEKKEQITLSCDFHLKYVPILHKTNGLFFKSE
jgi:hypothetical protein